MYLVDIGNAKAHVYDGREVIDLSYRELFENFKDKRVCYINVNPTLKDRLFLNSNWIDLEPYVKLSCAYEGMGIDRRVLLNSYESGVFVDAGSAITIDLKVDGKFIGGTILPGIWKLKSCYGEISSILNIETLESIDLSKLPNSSTKTTISYGIIAPIVALVKTVNKDSLPIYCCGGDGKMLSDYLDATYDELLIFKGMQKVIKENSLC